MLTVSHLCKAFGGQAVLEDVSLTLSPRQTVCLMAPSGRGKTTLLRCMAGLEKPDSGVIMGVPERIGYVFQEDRHLTELGLGGSLRQPVRELSGGMRRRVAICRAVCFGGGLLLLDEPFKGLDDALRQQVADYILRHRGEAAILCVTHDRADAAALGADIITL